MKSEKPNSIIFCFRIPKTSQHLETVRVIPMQFPIIAFRFGQMLKNEEPSA